MLNRFLIIAILSGSCLLSLNGQINTYSPYSRFGLGEIQKAGNIRSLSMGSAGLALRSNNQINHLNPASFTGTDTLSFLFDFGINGFYNIYSSESSAASLGNFNIHHFALAFPVTRWWKASAGVYPFSSVGYNIKEPVDLPSIGALNYYYNGNGGLNKLYLGNSVELFNRLSIGFNMNYIFGYIFYAKKLDFSGDPTVAIPRTENRLVIGDMMYQIGIQYNEFIKEKFFVTIGAVFENETRLKTTSHFLSELYFPGRSVTVSDSILLSSTYLISENKSKGTVMYPQNIGLGISIGIKDKLTLTGDLYMQDWSNSLIMGKSDSLVNSSSIHAGVEYIPASASVRSYLGRVNYRFGGFLTNSYISVRNEQIEDYGMTFGVGLPLRNTKTTFNVGCILGHRGTLKNDLIREQYGIVHVGVTFHDIWFRKRRYE